ncbi:MAG: hypothetical protein P8184_02780 [Calditrichia bacterium]
MTPFLGLLLILIITFIGARFFSHSAVLKSPLFSGLVVSGIPYILVGVLLGPRFFNFLNTEIIDSLRPLISLALGWIGLLFGIQLRWRNLQRFPRNYLLFTSVQSLITFVIIFITMTAVFFILIPSPFHNLWEAVFILAALGSVTAPLTISRILIDKRVKGRLSHLIQFIASLDSFWGITIAGLAMAVFHQPALRWFTSFWEWILLTIAISIFLGVIFRYLIQLRFLSDEVFLLVFGLLIFASGIGFYLRLSPIFIAMIIGITLAQFPRESEKVMRVLHQAEKPIYLFLLIFAGSLWNYRFWEEIILILFFIASRFAGKQIGGLFSARYINCAFPIPSDIGKATLSFGGVSLAIAFNFQLFYGGATGDFLMSATILAIFIFDEYTALGTLNILRRQGEIR